MIPQKVYRTLLPWLFAIFLGTVGIWQFHKLEFTSHFDLIPGNRADTRLIIYLLEHWYQTLLGKTTLVSPQMFFPVRGSLGYSDALLALALPFCVLRFFGLDLFSATQASIISLNFLTYLTSFFLLKSGFRLGIVASALGATFFSFNSVKFNQLNHLQLQPLFLLPVILFCLVTWGRSALVTREVSVPNRKRAFFLLSAAVLGLHVQLLTAAYPGWFFILWSTLFLILLITFKRGRLFCFHLFRKFWLPIGGAGVVFLVAFIPFLLLYLPVTETVGWRSYQEIELMIPEIWSLTWMGPKNYLWGWLPDKLPQIRTLPLEWEQRMGFGVVASFTWLAICFWSLRFVFSSSFNQNTRKSQQPSSHFFLLLTVLATTLTYLIGMKHYSGYSPWYLVYTTFPGAKSIRAVARYPLVLALPMSMIFAFICNHAFQKIARIQNFSYKLVALFLVFSLISLSFLEQAGTSFGFSKTAELKRLEKLGARLPENCSAFYVTADPAAFHPGQYYDERGVLLDLLFQIDAMLISIQRGIPTLNGYSGQYPKDWNLLLIRDPSYEKQVASWVSLKGIKGTVCKLSVIE